MSTSAYVYVKAMHIVHSWNSRLNAK